MDIVGKCTLDWPAGRVDAVIDTDAFNEVDDQFAIAYMLRSSDKINTKGIYAAPFFNNRSRSPEDGMEKSYGEIKKLLSLCGEESLNDFVFKGSRTYLPDEKTPVLSPAAENLIELSKNYGGDNRLYVIAIGAITNIASALLADPSVKDRITVVWLGGHALTWPETYEFNMHQDVAAARVVFKSGVPLVQLPCMGVVSEFYVTAPELDCYLVGKNALCDYLAENTIEYMGGRKKFWSKVIWDVTAVGAVVGGERFVKTRLVRAPLPQYDHHYSFMPDAHFIRYVWHIERDALMGDLFAALTK